MPQYLLLLYDDAAATEQFLKFPPDQIQKAMQAYTDWGNKARQAGFLVASNKLSDDAGRVIRPHSAKTRVTDGPFSESKELLGGYYIIDAASYDEAIQRTQNHPHLTHGTVVIRQIDSLR